MESTETVIFVSLTVVEYWLLSMGGVPRCPKLPDRAYLRGLGDTQRATKKHEASNRGITGPKTVANIS